MIASLVALAFLAPFARGGDEPTPESNAQRAEALCARLRAGEPAARDAAARELAELAAAEDQGPAPAEGADSRSRPHPVHDVLRKALRDDDAEVRFRVRRILGGPELRVARVIETLLEPQKTDDVRATMKALVDRADRGSVVFGLLRVARKAIASGVDSDTRFTQEVWKPYGLRGSGQLHEDLRFHMALDLLTEVVSDDDVPAVVSLLRENLGDSVDDVINVLSGRRDASRAALRHMLKDSSDVARENAARALGEIGTVEDVPAFSALLDDASPRVRRAAVSAFETLPVQASEAAKAAALANDPDPQVAIPALHVGSTYGQRSAGAAARKVLAAGKHHPIELRIEAARALARMSDAAAAAAVLRPVLAPDPSGQRDRDELLKFAAWSAGASGDQGSLESLEALASSEAGTYEAGVYFAIARAGGLRFLAQLAANGTDHSRRLALRALGSATGDTAEIAQALTTAAEQAFEPKSGGRDFNDFLAAYRALLDRSDERSRPAIGRLLETVVERRRGQGVTDQMLWTLVPIAEDALSKEAAPAFEKIVTGPGDPYLRRLAAEALSVVDAPRAKTFLSEQIGRTSNPELQAAMARGLARSGDPSHMDRAIETSKRDVDGKITGEMPRFALRGDVTGFLNMLGCDYAYAGKTEEAILCFRRMRWLKPDRIYNYSSYNIACSLSLAGKLDDALRWLRRSIRDGFHEWRHMRADPDFLNLNKDPRFLRLVDEMRTEQEIEPMEDGY